METKRTQEAAAAVTAPTLTPAVGASFDKDGLTAPQGADVVHVDGRRRDSLAWNMFYSPAVWAICIAHTTTDWVFYVMGDGTPAFLRDVLGLSLSQAGFFASAPALLLICTSLASARTADHLLVRYSSVYHVCLFV